MTPRRALVLRTFAQAYIAALPPAERIAFLKAEMVSINDPACSADLTFAAIAINDHADALHRSFFAPSPIPNPGVSP